MIIAACTDDHDIYTIARQQSQNEPAVFGNCYRAFEDAMPTLGANENLFITAHGTADGDDGSPVIGDAGHDFWVNGGDLVKNIAAIIPKGYSGAIYIDACESADRRGPNKSFIQYVKATLNQVYGLKVKVYGKQGEVAYQISRPNEAVWVATD